MVNKLKNILEKIRETGTLFYISNGKIIYAMLIGASIGLNLVFIRDAAAQTYNTFSTSGLGTVQQTGASGLLDSATTWICYRLAPATTALGIAKGFYDIKQHKPDAAKKAFITGAAGCGVMLAPTITNVIVGMVQAHNPGA